MTALQVLVAPTLHDAASASRRAEWDALCADLAEAIRSLDAREGTWTVSVDAGVLHIDERTSGAAREVHVPLDELRPLVDEYLEVVAQLRDGGEGDGYSRMDALDMAKKVTHDRAGRVLKRGLRPLGTDHEVARRTFSLLVALLHDTSALPNAHAALRPREIG